MRWAVIRRRSGVKTGMALWQAREVCPDVVFLPPRMVLFCFARGLDQTPVSETWLEVPVKSIGNSTTTPRDLKDNEEVKLVLYLLSESVAVRLRKNGFVGQVVEVYVRDADLSGCDRQKRLPEPTSISSEIEAAAYAVFRELYTWEKPIRSIGIRVSDLKAETQPVQLSIFVNEAQREKRLLADRMTDNLRRRFGFSVVQRGIMYQDRYLSSLDATADDHMIHPHSYLERGNRTGCERMPGRETG